MKQKINTGTHFFKTEKIRFFGCFLLLLFSFSAFSQQDSTKIRKEARIYINEAEDALAENTFPQAEANYRSAIAKDPANVAAKYNFGNAYYNKNKYFEAQQRYKQAAEVASSKTEKHRAFHNLGNVFMNQEKYPEAIEAFKNALRNNPTDEETRYNLALAKKMWEQEQENQQNDQQDDQEQNDENQQQDGEGGDQEQNEGDQSEEGDQKENDKQEGEDKKDEEGKPKEPKDESEGGEKDKEQGEQPQQQQPTKGQLSPQQIKNLLEAMNNEEQKVQEKVNAQKVKGQPTRTEKDW